ncbi:hypothetical protein B0T17DRAFT_632982 [Bombardia bombarda]|uniref:DUF7580 domain-containing protein n=1 Tax=Bombardia bombarda TaxID=252184 RepID=A0AA39X7T2_9PEZI|nr:hypothetical protein B0T17DRAFT_632982 [Bombardia bombarda]
MAIGRKTDALCLDKQARVYVDASESSGKVLTNLFILCCCKLNNVQTSLIDLKVQSELGWADAGLLTPSPSDALAFRQESKRSSGQSTTIPKERRKVVRWEDGASTSAPAPDDSTRLNTSVDLSQSINICSDFHRSRRGKTREGTCIGHIDQGFRHSFYPTEDAVDLISSTTNFISLDQILERYPVDHSISVPDQLRLARSIVSVVLKFHQTPWMNDYWQTQDLGFVIRNTTDFSDSLQTLHLKNAIGQQQQQRPDSSGGPGLGSPDVVSQELSDAMLEHGIRNLTLFSLGVVLLQIGKWGKVHEEHDIKQVRRLANDPGAPLGRRYRELMLRCLNSGFRFEDSLAAPRLQEAVYDSVVCELTDMINELDVEV